MDDADLSVFPSQRITIDLDDAGISLLNSGQDPDYCGFTSAVWAQQRMELAWENLEAHAFQDMVPAERFLEAADGKYGRSSTRVSSCHFMPLLRRSYWPIDIPSR